MDMLLYGIDRWGLSMEKRDVLDSRYLANIDTTHNNN